MRPRSFERGKLPFRPFSNRLTHRFNEAALFRTRKVDNIPDGIRIISGFNEAALFRTRKGDGPGVFTAIAD